MSHAHDGDLAPGLTPERHAHLLRAGAKLTVPADGLFDQALQSLLRQALETRAPRHPVFTKALTKARLELVLELLDKLLETPDRKARFSRPELEDLRGIAAAEHLGIVRVIEEDATYAGGILDTVARNLANHRGPLSVGAVRAALDPDGLMELSPEVEDFLVLAHAKMAPKPLRLLTQGPTSEKLVGRLTDDIGLVPVEMPSATKWQAAIHTAGLLGVSFKGKAITPSRLDELASVVAKAASELGEASIGGAIGLLGEWQALAGVAEPLEATPRAEVLGILRRLVAAVLPAGSALATVDALAGFSWNEARTTAIVSMAKPQALRGVLDVLRSDSLKSSIGLGRQLESDPARREKATAVMDRVRSVLVSDENIEPLRLRVDQEAMHIMQLLRADRPGGGEGGGGGGGDRVPPVEVRRIRSAADIEALASELQARLEEGKQLEVSVEILGEPKR